MLAWARSVRGLQAPLQAITKRDGVLLRSPGPTEYECRRVARLPLSAVINDVDFFRREEIHVFLMIQDNEKQYGFNQ